MSRPLSTLPIGSIYGDFEVIAHEPPYLSPKGVQSARIRCRCVHCGKESIRAVSQVRHQKRRCACQTNALLKGKEKPHLAKDLTGQRFGKLTVLYRQPAGFFHGYSGVVWHCLCDCGNECDCQSSNLINGSTTSCGCVKVESVKNNIKVAQDKRAQDVLVDDTDLSMIRQTKPTRASTTGARGVYHDGKGGYVAYITFQKKRRYLGHYDDLEEAKKARVAAEQKLYDPILEANGWDVPDREDR